MLHSILHSKINNATITATLLHYEGSITIDPEIYQKAKLLAYEKVHVLNLNNGNRLETYIIPGTSGSGEICLNGPAARLGEVGDKLTILSYVLLDEKTALHTTPVVVHLDESNKIMRIT